MYSRRDAHTYKLKMGEKPELHTLLSTKKKKGPKLRIIMTHDTKS